MEEIIIKTAHRLFACYGIKSMSMEQISKELHISKKTIYDKFKNKEELVYRVEETVLFKIVREIEEENSGNHSPVKKFLIYGNKALSYLNSFCPAYHKEIKYFQKAYQLVLEKQDSFYQQYLLNFREGQDKGFFVPEQDNHAVSGIYYFIISREKEEDYYLQYLPEMLLAFLRGICTEKGLIELEECVNSYKMQ